MLTRRQFLVQSALAAAASHVLDPSAAATTLAHTPLGDLRGEQANGIRIFRGVPFAQPPVGPLRFRPPQPVLAWKGERDATRFAAAAVQPNETSISQSEDCLYLNIWAPDPPGPHPVFVWIHGGGFTGGHSFDPLFDGTRFAQSGVVCITVAYRLGVLGFLDVSPLLGPSYAGSADNALRDLMAALSWVQQNISAFGGDPHRVTVGGESAGAKLTDMMMGIPSAAPLFQQMISESGGAERIWPKPRAEEVGRAFGAMWTSDTGSTAPHLLDAPAHQLITVQQRFTKEYPAHFPLRAEIDDTLIPRPPLAAIRAGSSRGKRLLLGTNRDESALFLGPRPAKPAGAGDLGNLTVEQFQQVADRYRQLYPDMTPEMREIRSVTAEEYWVPSLRVAEALMEGGGQAFVYRLDFPGEGRFAGLAFHSYDLRFVWDFFGTATPSPSAQKLATEMHTAWTEFIKGNAPSAPGLPPWPPYTPETRPTMILNTESRVEDAPDAAELALWQGLLT